MYIYIYQKTEIQTKKSEKISLLEKEWLVCAIAFAKGSIFASVFIVTGGCVQVVMLCPSDIPEPCVGHVEIPEKITVANVNVEAFLMTLGKKNPNATNATTAREDIVINTPCIRRNRRMELGL